MTDSEILLRKSNEIHRLHAVCQSKDDEIRNLIEKIQSDEVWIRRVEVIELLQNIIN